PTFRNNVRKLMNGLSNLVSFTNQFEQQLYTAQLMESVTAQLEYNIDVQRSLANSNIPNQEKSFFPKKHISEAFLVSPITTSVKQFNNPLEIVAPAKNLKEIQEE
ncbi:MAG: hypothetical protein ACQZ3M_01985, partial [cyanobacterium endosymbiont of Rhopalodia fuxianensis]